MTFRERLAELAKKERKIKEYKSRLRFKGRLVKKSKTKKGNIRLVVKARDDQISVVVIKSHKDRFALASELKVNDAVSVVAISKFRAAICTSLKRIDNFDDSRQLSLDSWG